MSRSHPHQGTPIDASQQPPELHPADAAEDSHPAASPPSDSGQEASPAAQDAVDDADAIAFGDVRTSERPTDTGQDTTGDRGTPDADGHRVVAWATRRAGKLRLRPTKGSPFLPTEVFLHLDAMLEMQQHASEDITVELGGVLLGRRGSKPDGSPYVVITDSLRARHYRATRGSFTFTHETWADLNRQRSELPDSTEIVGWYHTHPGWGVFLSDMDRFICDHFFADPDDVALVIDPHTCDTGLFVRRDVPQSRTPRRLDRFALYAHRSRSMELDAWAQYFSGDDSMTQMTPAFPGRQNQPVMMLPSGGSDGTPGRLLALLAVVSMGLQGIMIAVLTVFLISGAAGQPAPASDAAEIAARESIVDTIVAQIAADGPEEIGQSYRELVTESSSLRASNLGLLSRVESLQGELDSQRALGQRMSTRMDSLQTDLTAAEGQLAELQADGTSTGYQLWGHRLTTLVLGAGLGIVMAGIGGYGLFLQRRQSFEGSVG